MRPATFLNPPVFLSTLWTCNNCGHTFETRHWSDDLPLDSAECDRCGQEQRA